AAPVPEPATPVSPTPAAPAPAAPTPAAPTPAAVTQPTPPPELPPVRAPVAPPTGPRAGGPTSALLPLPRRTAPLQLPGVPDEPAWQAVPPVAFTTHWPEFGKAPREPTEARIAHDERYLYVAFRNGDSKPDAIKVSTLKRDTIDFGAQDLNCVL